MQMRAILHSFSQELAILCRVRKPQAKLDARILQLDPESSDFPVLRFGFVVPEAKLEYLAQKKNLEIIAFVSSAVERYLWHCCGDLSLKPFTTAFPLSTKPACMISLWTTKDFLQRKRKLRVPQVKHAIDVVRAELDLGDQAPMWYWDVSCGPWYVALLKAHDVPLNARDRYTCPLVEYNPPKRDA